MPSTISSKKEAPFSAMNAATFAALVLTWGGSSAGGRAHTAAALRGNRLIGVDFSGTERLPFDFGFGAGAPSRAQAMRPARQASSSRLGS